jgi:hypothetical protein
MKRIDGWNGNLLQRKSDRHAVPSARNDEPRPGRFEWLIRRDETQEAGWWKVYLQEHRQDAQQAARPRALKREWEAHGLGHGDTLRLHSCRAVGNDPSAARRGVFGMTRRHFFLIHRDDDLRLHGGVGKKTLLTVQSLPSWSNRCPASLDRLGILR